MAEANQGAANPGGLSIRELPIAGVPSYTKHMKVATLTDRRTAPPSEPQEWLFQTDLKDLLYPSVMDNGTNSAELSASWTQRSRTWNGSATEAQQHCC